MDIFQIFKAHFPTVQHDMISQLSDDRNIIDK